MANPTTFTKSAQNPAVQSRQFPKTEEGRADRDRFAAEMQAEGFRVVVTSKFGGRDMKTRQSFKVWMVHCFDKSAA